MECVATTEETEGAGCDCQTRSNFETNNGTNNASAMHHTTIMTTTEIVPSTRDDTYRCLPDGILGNRDVANSNDLNRRPDCSLDESTPLFDPTLIEVPFSAAGAEDEKYADGESSCLITSAARDQRFARVTRYWSADEPLNCDNDVRT
jgi:hypothetical protein